MPCVDCSALLTRSAVCHGFGGVFADDTVLTNETDCRSSVRVSAGFFSASLELNQPRGYDQEPVADIAY